MQQFGDPFRIRHAVPLPVQGFFLFFRKRRRTDLIELIGQHILLTQRFGFSVTQFLQLFYDSQVLPVLPAVLPEQVLVPGELVDQPDMGCRFQQGKMFGLPVDVHQQRPDLLQHAEAHAVPVDPGRAPAFRPDLPRQHQLVDPVIGEQVLPFEDPGDLCPAGSVIEYRFDRSPFGPFADK